MKVIALNTSARKDGNTAILINTVFEVLNREGIETEMIQLAGKTLHGCAVCDKCLTDKDKHCAIKNDMLNEILDQLYVADGILLGSPTYFCDVTANMRAFIERSGRVARGNDFPLRHKVGASVVAMRRAGAIAAFTSIYLYLHYMQMVIPGSSYWNVGIGWNVGDVLQDKEGLHTMKTLGRNMAWLLKKVADPS
jgi:multimeric flavodoxin WrbA